MLQVTMWDGEWRMERGCVQVRDAKCEMREVKGAVTSVCLSYMRRWRLRKHLWIIMTNDE